MTYSSDKYSHLTLCVTEVQTKLPGNFLVSEQLVNLGAVKADNDLAVNIYNGDSHLAGLFNGLLHVFLVFLDVLFGKGYTDFIEVIHGCVTKSAPVGAIYNNLCVCTHIISIALLGRFCSCPGTTRHPTINVCERTPYTLQNIYQYDIIYTL